MIIIKKVISKLDTNDYQSFFTKIFKFKIIFFCLVFPSDFHLSFIPSNNLFKKIRQVQRNFLTLKVNLFITPKSINFLLNFTEFIFFIVRLTKENQFICWDWFNYLLSFYLMLIRIVTFFAIFS